MVHIVLAWWPDDCKLGSQRQHGAWASIAIAPVAPVVSDQLGTCNPQTQTNVHNVHADTHTRARVHACMHARRRMPTRTSVCAGGKGAGGSEKRHNRSATARHARCPLHELLWNPMHCPRMRIMSLLCTTHNNVGLKDVTCMWLARMRGDGTGCLQATELAQIAPESS